MVNAREQHLLQQLAEGDSSSFWQLWSLHRKHLQQICFKLVKGKHADAEDLLSCVMHKVALSLPGHARNIRNVRAWLTMVTINCHRDAYRKNAFHTLDSMDEVTAPVRTLPRTKARSTRSPSEILLKKEIISMVERAVEELPPKLRGVSQRFFLQEKPISQIAKELEISCPCTRKRIQFSRRLLRKRLARYIGRDRPCYFVSLPKRHSGTVSAARNGRPLSTRMAEQVSQESDESS